MKIPSSLKTIVKLCSKDESTRYAIQGVCLERLTLGKCRVRVTDGRQMMDAQWKDSQDHEHEPTPFKIIVPADLWKTALASKEQDVILEEPIGAKLLNFDRGDCAIIGEYDSGVTFPDTEEVIPKYKKTEGVTFGINPAMLAEFAGVMFKADTQHEYGVSFQVAAADKPIVARIDNGILSIVGVVMPCTLNDAK